MSPDTRDARAWRITAALVAAAAFLPFARGVATGQAFFFRDLSRQFFPLRRFAVEGLLRGEVRHWNPLLNEGVPLSLPALSYPLDLLQLLFRDEAGFSLLLALHVPLGALTFLALCRGLGLGRTAAAGGAIAYALGGFYLSTLNFYVYLQAAAWAPLVALALVRAVEGRPRSLAVASALVGLALSTTGAELVAQTVLFGLVLAWPAFSRRGLGRLGLALVLGTGLAAPTLAALRAAVAGSARAQGFPTDVVLAQSLDPWSFPQILVGNWHGDLADLTNRWWGSNFFPLGFPYILSVYLGAALVAIALVGVLHGNAPARRVGLLALAGLVVTAGRFAGLAPLVDVLPVVHAFRYPSKVFFTVHLCAALLLALGLDRLSDGGSRRAWASLVALGAALGGVLVFLPALPAVAPGTLRWFLAGFLPPSYDWPRRVAVGDAILGDAAAGGAVAVLAALVAVATLRERLEPARAAALLAVLVGADLLRTGAGLNPMVTARFYEFSPELGALVRARDGGRWFACEPEASPGYFAARRSRPDNHDVWTFAVAMETLAPATNVGRGVATALSRDMTMLVPVDQVLGMEDVGPGAFPRIVERLRRAGVAHVACVEPIDSDALTNPAAAAPARIAPLRVHVADLRDPLPLRAVASGRVLSSVETPDRLEIRVEADRPTWLVVRDAWAAGWSATVDGLAAPIARADGRHRAVAIPAGSSTVVMAYRPRGLGAAIALSAACAALVLLGLRRRRDEH